MAIDETKRFTFISQGMPDDTFSVVQFKGTEGISRLYEFDITLASDDPEIDLKGILENPATLTIRGEDQDFPIHGILGQFEQLHEVKGRYFYRALLVPRLWQADLYRENQLFLDKTVPDIIEEILRQTGLTTQDYELKLTRSYQQWEYICQYAETDFDFISRWMEREGIYFFFQQGENNEKLIITDRSTAHEDIRGDSTITFSPPSGIVPEKEAIAAFICRQKRLPNKVILKDYNYRKPSLDLKAEAEVDASGRGDVYFYGEHFKTPEEGNELAKIRAEEIKCREDVYHGEGTAPNLCPGFFFTLEDHYRQSYNQKYLIVEVEHEGHQTGSLWAGVEKESAEGEKKLTYTNIFTVIRSDVQFRPERKTPKPKFYGAMNATVDAAGIGQYAEIDDEGRYKVKLPFDQSDTDEGKASRWTRMAQPYAGAEHGMHFPLHKGTEVLLTFVDGDPDRPIIAGAVPNVATKSVVTDQNYTKNRIRSAGGNVFEMEDQMGKERILLQTPMANSWIRMGSHNDPAMKIGEQGGNNMKQVKRFLPGDGIRIHTDGKLTHENPLYEEYHSEVLEDQNVDKSTTAEDVYNEMKDDEQLKENDIQLKNMEEHEHVRVRLGELVEAKKGDSIDIEYGGRHVDWLYRDDGTKRHYKMESGGSGGNWSEEKRWWGNGAEVYSKAVDQDFKTTEKIDCTYGEGKYYKMNFFEDWPPKYTVMNKETSGFTENSSMTVTGEKQIINNLTVNSNINIENQAYGSNISIENKDYGSNISIKNQACGSNMNIENNASGFKLKVNNDAASNIDISNLASLFLKLSLGAGFGLEIDSRVGGAFKLDPSGDLKFDGMGITARKKAALEAEKATAKAKSIDANIESTNIALLKTIAALHQNGITVFG